MPISVKKNLSALVLAGVAVSAPVHALEVSPADLEAAVRTFDFVETLPRRAPITIEVIYQPNDAGSKESAQRVASTLAHIGGAHAAIVAVPVAADELGKSGHHADVLYVMPGTANTGKAIADFVRRNRVLSISNDPQCLAIECCVLLVRAGARTEIVLDTSTAQQSGTAFSSVFLMMVKRR